MVFRGDSGAMEVFDAVKLKRKDLEDFSDDFSDFSISSPARKIRRLDGVPEMCVDVDHSFVEESNPVYRRSTVTKIEEISSEEEAVNEERAIVPYTAASTSFPPPLPPSKFSISVSPQFLSGLKNRHVSLLSTNSNLVQEADDEGESRSDNRCLAVIPWTPPSHSSSISPSATTTPRVDDIDMMDDSGGVEVEEAMEVEEEEEEDGYENRSSGMMIGDSFHQWQQQQQQQNFLVSPTPQNMIKVWYR